MIELHTRTTLLVDLRFAIYWAGGQYGQRFAPVAFAASVITEEDPALFLRSLDRSCLDRVRAATRYTKYRFETPVNFEVERSFVWKGLEESRLSLRGLSAGELESQLALMRKRGYQDCVRVEMAVEVEGGKEL
ncbi:hypothetical protein BT67DRAFT_351060, partial [Trichocladium antarcticum]